VDLEDIMITGLAHVCFVVPDLERSLAFYRDALGLEPAFDFVNAEGRRFGLYLHPGGRNFIELFEGTLGAPAEAQSFRHICLEVDDIDVTVQMLRDRGVEVTDVKLGGDQSYQAWIADPDGNRIELHGYTPQSWQAPWLK
jgi:glyoxylase I family protein